MATPASVVCESVCNYLWLAITTVIFVGMCVVNGLANSVLAPQLGFINKTEFISDNYHTQVTPADFSFIMWGVIYGWQALWLTYAWSFMCRPDAQHTIFVGVYVGYSIVNGLNAGWLYLWGNQYISLACVAIFLLDIFFYFSIGLLFGYFHHIKQMSSRLDRWLTRVLVLNGMCLYCTWSTLNSFTNLAAAIPPNSLLTVENSSTLCLSLVMGILLIYFALEGLVFDAYGFRYVVVVYPIAIWFLASILIEQWDLHKRQRNSIFTASLLGVAVLLFLLRTVLVALCCRYRKE